MKFNLITLTRPSILRSITTCCLFGSLLLNGCTLITSSPTLLRNPLPNDAISDWNLKGKIGFRTKKEGGSAHVRWIQKEDNYEISLSGPLGQGAATITGDKHLVNLNSKQTGIIIAETPEQLVYQAFGWQLPISNMFFWIKGIPTPLKTLTMSDLIYNTEGQLVSFTQDDWSIQYSRYRPVNGWLLPHKTILRQGDIKVTLIVSKWDLQQN